MLLEEIENDSDTINLCLQGYRCAIVLAAQCKLETPRLAFMSSLKKLTLLGTSKEMKQKNIEVVARCGFVAFILTNFAVVGNQDVAQNCDDGRQ